MPYLDSILPPAPRLGPIFKRSKVFTFRSLKNILLLGITGGGLAILIFPLLPSIHFSTHRPASLLPPTHVLASIATLSTDPAATPVPLPGPNTLTIPGIGVDSQIVEGSTEEALLRGVWHRPGSSTPDRGSNTVLAAHRFLYLSGPHTFYNLDKMQIGDQFQIQWSGRMFRYQVFSTEVVTDRATQIENATADPIVTLYTCTPLWTSRDRLVVQAKLLSN